MYNKYGKPDVDKILDDNPHFKGWPELREEIILQEGDKYGYTLYQKYSDGHNHTCWYGLKGDNWYLTAN